MTTTRRSGPVRTYTLEEKTALVTEIDRRYRAGEGALRTIAASLGITDTNYYNWLKAGIRPVKMRPVEVTAVVPAPVVAPAVAPPAPAPVPASAPTTTVTVASVASSLTLVSPGGYRIEGLAVETAAQLLRALA